MVRPLLLIILLSALVQPGKGQDSAADPDFTKAAYNNAVSLYHKQNDKQARLYQGVLHIGYSHKIIGHAYYPENEWNNGTVVYDGITYTNVSMMYDIYQDQLIIQHFHRLMMQLHKEKVKEFTFNNRRFFLFQVDTLQKLPFSTGFYEDLYKGKIQLIAKRQKIMEETITDVVEQRLLLKNYFYINRNQTWYAVKTYRDLTGVLKEKAKEIRQYLKKNKVKYRKDRERAILLAVQHFDAITQ